MSVKAKPVLVVNDLVVSMDGVGDIVRGVSLRVMAGKVVGLVGESGSGKTMLAMALMGLLPPGACVSAGSIEFEGQDLVSLPAAQRRQYMGCKMAMVFQDPMLALNPVTRIGDQIVEALCCHERVSNKVARERAVFLLERVRIPDPPRIAAAWPHQLSGGMRQRVMIAMALSCAPTLLIADEPTTALDATIQAQILLLLTELREELDMSVLLITHDFGVVAAMASEVAVMYRGQLMETAACSDLLSQPQHPYTQGLFDCIPNPDMPRETLPAIAGLSPTVAEVLPGCDFCPRCQYSQEECRQGKPAMVTTAEGHEVRCILARGTFAKHASAQLASLSQAGHD